MAGGSPTNPTSDQCEVDVTCLLALWVVFSAPASLGAGTRWSPIERAIGFLFMHQVHQPLDVVVDGVRVVDFPGNWPQYFHLQGGEALGDQSYDRGQAISHSQVVHEHDQVLPGAVGGVSHRRHRVEGQPVFNCAIVFS